MLWLAVHPLGLSHKRTPVGRSREEASGGDEEYEVRDGGQSREEDKGGC